MKEYYPFLSIEDARRAGALKDSFYGDKRTKKRNFVPIEEIPDSMGSPEDILISMESIKEEGWFMGESIKEYNPIFSSSDLDKKINKEHGHSKRVKRPWWKGRFRKEKIKEVMAEAE